MVIVLMLMRTTTIVMRIMLCRVIMSSVLGISVIVTGLQSEASSHNYAGGYALKELHRVVDNDLLRERHAHYHRRISIPGRDAASASASASSSQRSAFESLAPVVDDDVLVSIIAADQRAGHGVDTGAADSKRFHQVHHHHHVRVHLSVSACMTGITRLSD